MHALYPISVCVHILSATVRIGGMLFLVLVVVPWLRKGGRPDAAALLRATGERFRKVGRTCFGLLLVTRNFNLGLCGIRLADSARAEWLQSPFGKIVVVKRSAFLLVLMVSAIHDFVVGPLSGLAGELPEQGVIGPGRFAACFENPPAPARPRAVESGAGVARMGLSHGTPLANAGAWRRAVLEAANRAAQKGSAS